MGKITKFEIWVCRKKSGARPGGLPDLYQSFGDEVVIVRLTTDDGFQGVASVLAACGTAIPMAYLKDVIAPVCHRAGGARPRGAMARAVYDQPAFRLLPPLPPRPGRCRPVGHRRRRSSAAPLPVLGAYRSKIPTYASSRFMPDLDDYLEQARHYERLGVTAYRSTPGGLASAHRESLRLFGPRSRTWS